MNFKKLLPLSLTLIVVFLWPQNASAGLSDQCFPSVQCDDTNDYYAGACSEKIDTVDDCPIPPFGQFSAFSCDHGCYFRTRPEFEECAGGVMVGGTCMTTLKVVNDENQSKIWDGVLLKDIGAGGEGGWETDGTHVFRNSGNVGIGVINPEDYPLDVAGPINLNRDIEGPAIYVNQRQMLWFNKEFGFAAWGLDATKNFFPKSLGVGAVPQDNALLHVAQSTSESEPVFNVYNKLDASGSGVAYGISSIVESTNSSANGAISLGHSVSSNNAYGSRGEAIVSGANNTSTAYGVYGKAYNGSGNCNGGCNRSFGVYGTTGGSTYGAGVYGESQDMGMYAVGLPGGASTVAMMVDNQNPDKTGLVVECEGDCTSAHFLDGNEVQPGVVGAGMAVIGSYGGKNIALDNDEIAARNGANSATLFLNPDGGSVSLGSGFNNPSHKLHLPNILNDLKGRGISTGWETYSDIRVKQNRRPLEYGLESLLKLSPQQYDHYSGYVQNGQVHLGDEFESTFGFIAQEVQKVIPEAVQKPEDEANQLWSIDYDKFSPVLVKALQELKVEKDNEIEQLEVEIEFLKTLVCLDHPNHALCQ